MRRYRVSFQAEVPHLGHSPESLALSLRQVLPDLLVEELELDQLHSGQATLVLEREDARAAVNELFIALQELGYSAVAATVSEWVDARVAGALIGALGGSGAGAKGAGPSAALLAGALGFLAGAAAGAAIRSERVIFRVEPTTSGQWALRRVSDSPANPLLTPSFA